MNKIREAMKKMQSARGAIEMRKALGEPTLSESGRRNDIMSTLLFADFSEHLVDGYDHLYINVCRHFSFAVFSKYLVDGYDLCLLLALIILLLFISSSFFSAPLLSASPNKTPQNM